MRGVKIGVAGLLVLACTSWAQAGFVNGSFETGDYTGWTVADYGAYGDGSSGTWGVGASGTTLYAGQYAYDYADGQMNYQSSPGLPMTFQATDGSNVAFQTQNGGQDHRMYQDLTINRDYAWVSWDMSYTNHGGYFCQGYQNLLVTIRNVADDSIIRTLVDLAGTGGPTSAGMTNYSYDLSDLAGQNVRFDVSMAVWSFYFDAVFDNFRSGPAASGVIGGQAGASSVPEPATMSVLAFGALGLVARRRKA